MPRAGWLGGILVVLGVLVLGACGDDSGGTKPPSGDLIFPKEFLNDYVLVRGCRFSTEHDGNFIAVYCNPGDAGAYTDGTYPLPEGTTLVKIEYADETCTQIVRYSVMRRLAGNADPGLGDWEWQRVDANFNVIASPPPAGCFSCHTGCTDGRDFTCTDP